MYSQKSTPKIHIYCLGYLTCGSRSSANIAGHLKWGQKKILLMVAAREHQLLAHMQHIKREGISNCCLAYTCIFIPLLSAMAPNYFRITELLVCNISLTQWDSCFQLRGSTLSCQHFFKKHGMYMTKLTIVISGYC